MPEMTFKLYHSPALRSSRVKWLLHELVGDAFKLQTVATYYGEQHTEHYLAINPNATVPSLEITIDGHLARIHESGACIVFLADLFPEKRLAPPVDDVAGRADYLQVIHFCGASADMALWQTRIHEHVLPPHERDERTVARYRNKFAKVIQPQFKSRLESTGYASGHAFSAADCVMAHDVMWARHDGLCQEPVFQDYVSRMSERPAFQAAFADIGQFKPDVPHDSVTVTQFTG